MALGRLGLGRRSLALLEESGDLETGDPIEVNRYGDLEGMSLFRADPHHDLASVSLSRSDSSFTHRQDDLIDRSLSRPDPAWLWNGWSRLV
jgi:hypothetical protein